MKPLAIDEFGGADGSGTGGPGPVYLDNDRMLQETFVAAESLRVEPANNVHTKRGSFSGVQPSSSLKISFHALAIPSIFLAVVLAKIGFLTQHLAMKQAYARYKVRYQYPIRLYQEFTKEEKSKGDVHRIAREPEDARGNKSVGAVGIDADAEAPSKRYKAYED
jgi:hypothetical protein